MNTPTPRNDALTVAMNGKDDTEHLIALDTFARQLEQELNEAEGIVLSCHRAFAGGSDFVQYESRRLAADLVARVTKRIQSKPAAASAE